MNYINYIYSNIILILLLLWLIISASFSVSNLIFFIGIFALIIGTISYKLFLNIVIGKKYGKLINSYSNPQPLTTIMDALSMEKYRAEDIKQIDLVSYQLKETCNYSKEVIFRIINLNKNVQFNIIGYGTKSECEKINSDYANNLHYFPIRKKLTEHKNLIYMNDGRTFLWYEPSHKIENGKHYFLGGGYFIEPRQEVLESIKKEISKLKK